MKIGSDDPRLTAYALGEASDPEVAAAIEQDEQLRAEVIAIQEFAVLLSNSLRAEAIGGLAAAQRALVMEAARQRGTPRDVLGPPRSAKANPLSQERRWPFVRRRLAVASLAMVGLMVGCILGGVPGRASLLLYPWLESIRNADSQADVARSVVPTVTTGDALRFLLGLKSAESLGLAEFAGGAPSGEYGERSRPYGLGEPGSEGGLDEWHPRLQGSATEQGQAPEAAPGTAATPGPASSLVGPELATDAGIRKIIKDGTLSIEVQDVRRAMGQVTAAAVELGGYVLETQTYDTAAEGSANARLTVAVPVHNFESLVDRVRRLGDRTISESITGRDATREYVDLQSQIANLEATQARIRQFLERAHTVDEALRVNARLTEIEGQISQLKGQLQYLAQRAAYSTLTVELWQAAAPATPTPTPAPVFWQPDRTARQAARTLSIALRALGDLAIWLAIAVLPLALPLTGLLYGLHRLLKRPEKPASSSSC